MKADFTSVDQARQRARRRLPRSVYQAVVGGSERGTTLADNEAAFAEWAFVPPAVPPALRPDLTTTVLGQHLALPVVLSPAGVQAVHPHGEVAVARAAAAAGLAFGLSCFASKAIEDVVAVNPQTLCQLHWTHGRAGLEHQVERARRAGAVGLVLTLDWSFATGRDWGSPVIPERVDLATMARFAPQVLRRPGWLASFLADGLPTLTVPNLGVPGAPVPTFFQAYRDWQRVAPPSWADVAWLAERWNGTFLLKGIARPDDARRAVDAGVSAVSVSNHGGNNLDSTPGALRMLPGVVAAVGDQVEVLLDGGVRRGNDIAIALALGARAVLIGRAYLWGLAAGGQAGVERVLQLLRRELEATMRALGRSRVDDLDAADLVRAGARSR